MIVAHLSDAHLRTGPIGAEPAIGLHRALGRLLALEPVPDLIVITGDLADHGRPEEYAVLAELLAGVSIPVHLVAGNHDDPAALVDAFGGSPLLAGGHRTHYTVEHDDLTLIVLDSHGRDDPAGRLGGEQLHWLDDELTRLPDPPALVCLHHPPVPVGLGYLDGQRLSDADDLAAVLGRHPQVAGVPVGHLHRTVSAPFAGTSVHVAPSLYRQSAFDTSDTPPGYVHEPPAFLLHVITDDVRATHLIPTLHAAGVTAHY